MNRILKQIVFGLFYTALFGAIGYGVFLFVSKTPLATCFDNIQNQKEEGVDCGPEILVGAEGPFPVSGCVPCELKNAYDRGIQHIEPKVLPVTETSSNVILQISNPSRNYGVRKFGYTIELLSKFGPRLSVVRGITSLNPGETKYIVESGLGFAAGIIGGAEFKPDIIDKASWRPYTEFGEKLRVIVSQENISESDASLIIDGEVGLLQNGVAPILLIGVAFDRNDEVVAASTLKLEDVSIGIHKFKLFLPRREYHRINVFYDILPE